MADYDDLEADRAAVRELFRALPHCDTCAIEGVHDDDSIATCVTETNGSQLCEGCAEGYRKNGGTALEKPQRAALLKVRSMIARWARPKKGPVRCDECSELLVHVPAREAGIVDMTCGPEHWITWGDGARGVVTDAGFEFAERDEKSEDPAHEG